MDYAHPYYMIINLPPGGYYAHPYYRIINLTPGGDYSHPYYRIVNLPLVVIVHIPPIGLMWVLGE